MKQSINRFHLIVILMNINKTSRGNRSQKFLPKYSETNQFMYQFQIDYIVLKTSF